MKRLDRHKIARVAVACLLTGATLLTSRLANAAPAATGAITAPTASPAAVVPPVAPELTVPVTATLPSPSTTLPASTPPAALAASEPAAPGRMSPTAPMVQPTPQSQAAPAAAAPSGSAATAAVASAGSLTQVALVLLLVVGLIAGAAWLLKRLGMVRNAGGTTVRIVGGVSLSNRERILVVEVADQWIVVGVAPGSINTLTTMPRQEQAPGATPAPGFPTPAGSNFAQWLKQTIDKRGAAGNNDNGK